MTRFFSVANFVGVLAVMVLCAVQWQANSRLAALAQQLDQTRRDQAAKIDEQTRSLKDDAADMEDLRQRLMMSESEATKLVKERDQLVEEKKELIAALEKWAAAVKQRDAALKQASADIQTLIQQRNDAIAKFNDLATKYNNVIKNLQDVQAAH